MHITHFRYLLQLLDNLNLPVTFLPCQAAVILLGSSEALLHLLEILSLNPENRRNIQQSFMALSTIQNNSTIYKYWKSHPVSQTKRLLKKFLTKGSRFLIWSQGQVVQLLVLMPPRRG